MKEKFIISIKAHNRLGLLSHLTGMISKKQIDIESISAAKTDVSAIILVIIELAVSKNAIRPLISKLENVIEVYAVDAIKASLAICHCVAHFKLSKGILGASQSAVLRKPGVKTLNIYPESILISQSGTEAEIYRLYNELEGPYLLSFVRSGYLTETTLIDSDIVTAR